MNSSMKSQTPDSATVDPSVVRLQLDRILASPQLRNSKRSQAFLRFVVEAILDGSPESIKERTIGVQVFGRDPDYDTNEDSVVRNAAIEVRKRLAQYYLEPGHENELRIVLPQMGYLPEFRAPSPAAPPSALPARTRRWWPAVPVAILILLAAVWLLTRSRPDDLDRFWAPLIEDRGSILICVGQPSRVYGFTGPRQAELDRKMGAKDLDSTTLTLRDLALVSRNYLFFGDALCLVKVGALLQSRNKPFQVRGVTTTPYQDLRGHPVVLVGLFNNPWTQRLTGSLRYYFVRVPEQRRDELRDRQNADRALWSVPGEPRSEEMYDDYAIVARVFDASTEKTLVAIAAVTQAGTQTAGEFVSHPGYMKQAFHDAPADWNHKNIQLVLKVRVVTGAAGPPVVVARHLW